MRVILFVVVCVDGVAVETVEGLIRMFVGQVGQELLATVSGGETLVIEIGALEPSAETKFGRVHLVGGLDRGQHGHQRDLEPKLVQPVAGEAVQQLHRLCRALASRLALPLLLMLFSGAHGWGRSVWRSLVSAYGLVLWPRFTAFV